MLGFAIIAWVDAAEAERIGHDRESQRERRGDGLGRAGRGKVIHNANTIVVQTNPCERQLLTLVSVIVRRGTCNGRHRLRDVCAPSA